MEILGHGKERVKPRPVDANEGRVNPNGIPVLYLASQVVTAISEIWPWIGSEVSVAKLRIIRELRILNLTEGHGKIGALELKPSELFGESEPDADRTAKAVWINIDNAFSQSVIRSENPTDYVPTQILTELFRSEGCDAVVYRSQFGDKGYNFALFDMQAAEVIDCRPYTVTKIEFCAEEMGDATYYA